MPAEAVKVRSPIASSASNSKHSSSSSATVQNPNLKLQTPLDSNFNVSSSSSSWSNFPGDQPSVNSTGPNNGSESSQRAASASYRRSRPRLVKLKKHSNSRAVSNEVSSGFNPFLSSNGATSVDGHNSSRSDGKVENGGFVFGVKGCDPDPYLYVREEESSRCEEKLDFSEADNAEKPNYDCGRWKVESERVNRTINPIGFVFSADHSNLNLNMKELNKNVESSGCKSNINPNNGNEDLGFVFNAGLFSSVSNPNMLKGESFVFGSSIKKSYNLDKSTRKPRSKKVNFKAKNFRYSGGSNANIQPSHKGVETNSQFKFSIGHNGNSNSSSVSSKPVFTLPDEMKNLNINDSRGTAENNNYSKDNASGNEKVSSTFRGDEKKFSSSYSSEPPMFPLGCNVSFGKDQDCKFQVNGDAEVSRTTTSQNVMGKKDKSSFLDTPDGSWVFCFCTDFKLPLSDPSYLKENLFPQQNKVGFGKSRSNKNKKANKTREKFKQSYLRKQWLGKNHVVNEGTPQFNGDSPGAYSPMDFSPYQENIGSDQNFENTFVISEDSSFASHSTVLNAVEEERLTTVREFRSENETVRSCHKNEQFSSSNSAGLASEELRAAFSSNTNEQQNSCSAQFCFVSGSEELKGKNFTFSASSDAQGSVSATKHRYRKTNRGKSGQDKLVSSAEFAPSASSSSTTNSMNNPKVGEFKQGHFSFSTEPHETFEDWRLRGNDAYKKGDLSKAEDLYTHGISSVPSNERMGACLKSLLLCYSNRAATRMRLGRIREALEDCEMAMGLDPNFLKIQVRAAKCHLLLGELENALKCFNKCLESGAGVCLDRQIIIEAANGLQNVQKVAESTCCSADFVAQRTADGALSALDKIAEALAISLYSEKLLEMKAEALCMLQRYEEVIQLCEQTLPFSENNAVSMSTVRNPGVLECESRSFIRPWRWCLISKSYFYMGKLETALEFVGKLEQVACIKEKWPDLEPALTLGVTIRELLRHKSEGNEAFRLGKYAEAIEHYTVALSINVQSRPFAAICLCNRAAAYQALSQIADAIADCSLAIALDRKYLKAVSRRATLHEKLRDYGQAASDLQRLITILENRCGTPDRSTGSVELKKARKHLPLMEEEAKKGISLDLYLILGIKPADMGSDIKKAYRKAALRHHPDKAGQFLARSESGEQGRLWKEISDEVHKDADRLFKIIGEAYAVLSDPTKRSEYDLEEENRKAAKENNNKSCNYRRTSDFYGSSPYEKSTNRRSYRQTWKTYGDSYSRG